MPKTPAYSQLPVAPSGDDQPAPVVPHLERSRETLRAAITTIVVIVLALVFAFLLTQFVFQSYQVDGPSMQPTLHNNDRLIVLKVQRTWARLTGHPYIPNRGDVIIFSENNLAGLNSNQPKDLVKRVIGLPGDHLVIRNGSITIYDKQYPNGFDPDTTLAYGKSTHIPFTSDDIDITVPAGDVFVCGDNRGDSEDSRIFGPVPVNQIIGKLALRVFPLSSAEKF